MRKAVIALILLFTVAIHEPPRAEAGAFATEVTQALNHAQLILSYLRQGVQLANEIKMYQDMQKNSAKLSSHNFGNLMADIKALAAIVQGGQALAYSLGNLDAIFRRTYPGYGDPGPVYYRSYQNWSQTSLDTTLGVLRAAGLQGQQLANEQSAIAALRSSLTSTDGRLQAMQALGDISEQQVEQLQKLRQLMIADISSKQAYQATIIQQQAAREAATERFFTWSPASSDGQTFQPGWK